MKLTSAPHPLRKSVLHLSRAMAMLFIAAPGFAQAQVELKPVEISGAKQALQATDTAPSQSSLESRSAQSIVSDEFIRNYTSPVSDYTQALTMTPGVFSYTANGVGLGDSKITMRGLSDSFMVISFDGIPFNDTNGVSHHSWAWFPSQTLGGAVVDRSPGSAATLGQATFAGNVDLRSRILEADARSSVMASMGTWNTNVLGFEQQTGQFGADGKSSLMFNVEKTDSNGYETFNDQHRKAYSGKYQYVADSTTTYTLFSSYLDMTNHTGSVKGITRKRFDAGDYTYMNSENPSRGDFYGYNFYNLTTDFSYAGIDMALGNGWKMEDKLYRYSYTNHQKYVGTKPETATIVPNATAGADKLNSYKTYGNVLRLTKESDTGILRTGLWLDNADSYRFTYKSNPLNWMNVALPEYSETYTTTTIQPYLEYEFKVSDKLSVTPGVKYAAYSQKFNQLADAATVGNKLPGGATSIDHSVDYNDTLPSLDVRYKLSPNWSVYGQYAMGDQIPSTGVFDVTNANVAVPPKPTKAATTQFGTVYNTPDYTLSADVYYSELDGTYTSSTDSNNVTTWLASGTQINQGIEAEANLILGGGFSIYANATYGSLKFSSGKWVAGAPSDTETIGLNYARDGWAIGVNANRVGQMYSDGADKNGVVVREAFTIDPVVLSNLFINYTIKSPGAFAKQTKVQFGVNNLMDSHSMTGIATAQKASTSAKPDPTDVVNVLPGRSINLTLTVDF